MTGGSDGRLKIGSVVTTMMACVLGSLDSDFGQALETVESFSVEGGELLLGLEGEGGRLRFRAVP
uniref:META domain-containing protein n=1 Tax=Marinobacterium profundum TaxID=1714300 RepID=UPI000A3DBB3E|nr:META domain-containing protein [Marinobacterium profundum]